MKLQRTVFCRNLLMSLVASALIVSEASVAREQTPVQDPAIYLYQIKSKSIQKDVQSLRAEGFDVTGIDLDASLIDVLVPASDTKKTARLNTFQMISKKGIDPKAQPDSAYTTYDELLVFLTKTTEDNPDITKLESIGKTHDGREIWAVKISDDVAVRDLNEPVIYFNAMHHAREIMTVEVGMDMIEQLTSSYRTGGPLKSLVENNEIWVIPMVNPDGNNKVWTGNNMWRKNSREGYGVDINRNYPYRWADCGGSSGSKSADDYRGPSAGSEPETNAITNFIARIQPVIGLSYHSYSEMVLYPYSCRGEKTPDHNTVKQIGEQLASRLPKDNASGHYSSGTPWELLYPVDGGDIDWAYAEHDVYAYVIEMSSTRQGFQPEYKWRQKTVEKMRAGWKFLIERASGSGVRGLVRDDAGRLITTGRVNLQLAGDTNAAVIKTTRIKKDGTFHMITEPGMYQVTVISGEKTVQYPVTVGASRIDLSVQL